MNDTHDEDNDCPACGYYPTKARRCPDCEGDDEDCETCGGDGVERWCPLCGARLVLK